VFSFGVAFCRARFQMLIDNVLEPGVLTVVAATCLKWLWKLLLPHKPVDMLAGIFDPLAGQIRIAENTHRDAPCHGDEQFVASWHFDAALILSSHYGQLLKQNFFC
jgi:hypothetical protein